MALLYRKRIRDAAKGFLAAGFNSNFAALASAYAVTAFTIDFTAGSRNFAQCSVDPDKIEDSQILDFPGVTIYTTEAEDTGEPRGLPFYGGVILAIDFYVRLREGAEQNTEDLMDAVEDAVMETLNNPANVWPEGVLFGRKSKINRMSIQPLKDGFQQLIRVESQFGSASVSL